MPLLALSWTPDGQHLVSSTNDLRIRFWEPTTGKVLRTVAVTAQMQTLSRDARAAAASGRDGRLTVSNLEGGEGAALPGGTYTTGAVWSPRGDRLAVAHDQGGAAIWDPDTGRMLRRLAETGQYPVRVAWSPTGDVLAVTSNGRQPQVRLWNPETGAKLTTVEADPYPPVAWSRDGRFIATTGADNTVRTWEAATGKALQTLSGHTKEVFMVAWSADGETLASGGVDTSVRLWDVKTGKVRHVLKEHDSYVHGLAWSPDGKTLAALDFNGTVIWWDAADNRVRHKAVFPATVAYGVAWSPDGKLLAAGSGEKAAIRLFDGASGELLRRLPAIPNYVGPTDFSPDGKTLLAHAYGCLQLLDMPTGQPRGTLTILEDGTHLALTAEGHWRGSPSVEDQLVYIAVTDAGQETLTYAEFSTKYGWKNDPDKVRLLEK